MKRSWTLVAALVLVAALALGAATGVGAQTPAGASAAGRSPAADQRPALGPVADPHSLSNATAVRPTHIALDLSLDFEQKRVSGTALLTLEYLDPKTRTLQLDTRGLRIDSVSDAGTGRALPFVLEPTRPLLGERLLVSLHAPAPRKVRIAYASSPGASALQWLEPRQTSSRKRGFLFTQAQSIHARSFVPCMDSPGVRQTFEAVVRVPPGYTAVMGAEAGEHEPAKGIFRFRMPQAVPAYLFSLAAGELAFRPLGPRTGVWAEPDVLPRAAKEFVDMEAMLRAAEGLYGPYGWGRWDVIVLPPSFPFGGMENPRLTFATPTILAGDRSLVGLLAHELAHSWSGNLVTSATWADFWLNEGVTTYIENRLVEALYGREVAEMQALLSLRLIQEAMADPSIGPEARRLRAPGGIEDPDGDVGAIVYDKGAAFLRVLERRFGRPRFDAFLRSYFAANAFRSMTTAGFLETLKHELFAGDEAAWSDARVEEWVFGSGLPENVVVPASTRFDRTRAAAAAFTEKGELPVLRTGEWTTDEWLDFLSALGKPLPRERMQALDDRFALSGSGNSEILFAWLVHVVASRHQPAYPALESFLVDQGRRKFLQPLYQAMQQDESLRDLAQRIYAKARPGYHPISAAAIDAILR